MKGNALKAVRKAIAQTRINCTLGKILESSTFIDVAREECEDCSGSGSYLQFPCYCRLRLTKVKQ